MSGPTATAIAIQVRDDAGPLHPVAN